MEKKLKQKFILMIFGPTAVGKSGLAETLAEHIPSQLVNCDIGQFYTPLTIGTAKPDYKNSPIKQHLFDVIDKPRYFNVCEYRRLLLDTAQKVWTEGQVPILVGGSGFYLKSLFFPPLSSKKISDAKKDETTQDVCGVALWDLLNKIDPVRAAQIEKNDTYRIRRALDIWEQTGKKPSELTPVYNFPSNFLFIFLHRDRQELYDRIDERTHQMVTEGWIEEVQGLLETEWEPFLMKKKIIGYDVIIEYLKGEKTKQDLENTIKTIQKKTRNYAKRQVTFFKSLEKQLQDAIEKKQTKGVVQSRIETIDLTLSDLDLYIKQLLHYLKPLFT